MRFELITFGSAGQLFGIDIMAIREIRAWSPVTRLPSVAGCIAGVVNLRGAVLPVIDLSVRLGWAPTQTTPRNPMIIQGLAPNGDDMVMVLDLARLIASDELAELPA